MSATTGASVPVTASVLRWARESAGFTAEEIAALVHHPVAELNAWETGSQKPNLTTTRRLAELYRRPMAAFLLPTPPAEPGRPVDFRSGVAATQRLSRDTRVAIRRAQRIQAAAAEVFDALDVVPALAAGSFSDESNGEAIAGRVRERLGTTVSMQFAWKDDYAALRSWRDVLGDLGVLVLQASLPMEEIRGFSLSTPGPPTVVVNTRDYVPARIFTIFHEVTHIVKGGGGLCLPEPQLARPTGSPTEEMFCNLVSGHLLVPTGALVAEASSRAIAGGDMATEERELKRLAARFKVSQQVIWYRLHEVGLVSLDAYRSRWAMWTSRPFEPRPHAESGSVPMISAAKRAVSETGRSVLGPMFEAYDRGLVGTADLIDWLDVHVEDLPNVEKLLREPTD